MERSSCICVGKILKIHGINGEMVLHAENPRINLKPLKVLFIDLKGNFVPYFISEIKVRDTKSYFINFDTINTPEKAAAFVGCDAYASKDKLEYNTTNNDNVAGEFKGFEVIDTVHGHIGLLEEITEIPGNPLMKIVKNEKEILIPLSNEIIVDIDKNKRIITVKTPDGLIELYLK